MTKQNFFSTLIFLVTSGSNCSYTQAQETSDPFTLFGRSSNIQLEDLGVFIAPAIGFTQMDGGSATIFNVRSGVSFNDRISVGAYFNHFFNEIIPESETIAGIYMDHWIVGGFVEYTLLSNKLLHLTLPLYIGYGEVEMDNRDDIQDDLELGEANFFQIEPSVLIELNLHRFVRFNIGGGYRIVGDMSYRNFTQSDISGLTVYIGFRLGLF